MALNNMCIKRAIVKARILTQMVCVAASNIKIEKITRVEKTIQGMIKYKQLDKDVIYKIFWDCLDNISANWSDNAQ